MKTTAGLPRHNDAGSTEVAAEVVELEGRSLPRERTADRTLELASLVTHTDRRSAVAPASTQRLIVTLDLHRARRQPGKRKGLAVRAPSGPSPRSNDPLDQATALEGSAENQY
jgi:hypothetical protein